MREINEIVTVTDQIETNKVAVKENIYYHVVNSKLKSIGIGVEWLAADGFIVKKQTYTVDGEDYMDNPTVEDLWRMIDKLRGLEVV